MPEPQHAPAAARYSQLEVDRFVFLKRAREASEFTLPMLFPPQGHSSATSYQTPYQSLGARGVNQLASKLLLALFPPEQSFFRLTIDPQIAGELQDNEEDEFEAALSDMEQTVLKDIAARGIRSRFSEGLKHLIVGGNVLLHFPAPKKGKKAKVRMFRLDQYCVLRDHEGNVLEIVVKECLSPASLPASVRQKVLDQIAEEDRAKSEDEKQQSAERTVDLYTWVRKDSESNDWKVCQEVKGFDIPEAEGTYPEDYCPWFPLRWSVIDGENYGRSYCEEYLGDLASLEGLSKALVQGGAAAAKVLFLVNPNGQTRMESLADAPNGAIREGIPEDVKVVQLEKSLDMQFAAGQADKIEQRLSYAFLLTSAIQRDAERVTAEEIRTMAQELEDALGGVYSLFSEEFQLPLALLVMHQLEKLNKLPKLPDDTVNPAVVAGLDALGRNHELNRLDQGLQGVSEIFGPQVVAQYVNAGDYITRRFSALGVKTKGLVKSDDQVQAEQQQAQQQQMQQAVAPHAVKGGMDLAKQQMQQDHENQQQEGNQS